MNQDELEKCRFDIINETPEELAYSKHKSKIVRLHQDHGLCTFTRGVFYMGFESRQSDIDRIQKELDEAVELLGKSRARSNYPTAEWNKRRDEFLAKVKRG